MLEKGDRLSRFQEDERIARPLSLLAEVGLDIFASVSPSTLSAAENLSASIGGAPCGTERSRRAADL